MSENPHTEHSGPSDPDMWSDSPYWKLVLHARAENKEAIAAAGQRLAAAVAGLGAAQFDAFRRNYVYRTTTTLYTVAATVAAALRHDPPMIDSALRTTYGALLEELGPPIGKPGIMPGEICHLTLLYDCLNSFAGHYFRDLAPLSPRTPIPEAGLLPEALTYRRTIFRLFDPGDPASTMGAAYALEYAADGMLQMLDDSFLTLIRLATNPDEEKEGGPQAYRDYFGVHKKVEPGHGAAALENLKPFLLERSTRLRAVQAAVECFEVNSTFFEGLATAVEQSRGVSTP